MSRDDVTTELDRRIAELRGVKKSILANERIDELRVFKKWVEEQRGSD